MATFNYAGYPSSSRFFFQDLAAIPKFKPKVFRLFSEQIGAEKKFAKKLLQHGIEPSVKLRDLGPGS
jgi:hypothetical protein